MRMGEPITYTITYTNIGERTATDIQIWDELLFAGLEYDVNTTPVAQRWDYVNNS